MTDHSVANFFLERILTNVTRINEPGYLTSSFPTIEGQSIFERMFFIPESFFVNLENEISQSYPNGKSKLYSIGKKFGYRFASILKLSKKDPITSASSVFRFLQTIYADKISIIECDPKSKKFILETKNLAITSKNGMGYILTVGGCAGIWDYLTNDYSVECSVKKESDTDYQLICAPDYILKNLGLDIFKCDSMPEHIETSEYKSYNTFKNDEQSSDNNFHIKKMIETQLLTYENGNMEIAKHRIILVEISLLHEIENTLDRNTIYNAAYGCFYELGKDLGKYGYGVSFLSEILTSFGFGIVTVIVEKNNTKLNFSGYPYTPGFNTNTYSLIRGLISGYIDGNSGNKITSCSVSSKFYNNSLVLSIGVFNS